MMVKARKPGKRGRPKLPPSEVKRTPLSLRTTKALRDWLDAAANKSGRSLAQEVELRLEQSRWIDASITRLGEILALVVRQTEGFHGKRFEDSAEVRRQATINLGAALDALAGADVSFGPAAHDNFIGSPPTDRTRHLVLRFQRTNPEGRPVETSIQFLLVDYD